MSDAAPAPAPKPADVALARIRAVMESDVLGARRIAEEALAGEPGSDALREALLMTYLRTNDMEGAIALCDRMPPEKLTSVMHEARGVACLQLGDNAGALESFRAAARQRPLALIADRTGRALHRLGKIGDAVTAFRSIAAQLGKNEPLRHCALRQLAYALRDSGRWAEADQAIQELLAVQREQPYAVASAVVSSDMEMPYRGWMVFLNKGSLAHALDEWRARHPGQPAFWPESFVIPGDEEKLARFRAAARPPPIFAVKPENLYGGQGIALTRDPPTALGQPAVIQRYIDNPYLIGGRKFHARVYVLIAGTGPVRAYVYREGIARIAPEVYAIDDASLARPGMHVTNTALHLKHPKLKVSQDPREENVGNVWTMSAIYRQMKADGVDPQLVWSRIAELARRFVGIAVDIGIFARQASEHTRYCFPPRAFGLDVLIDATGRPWLIEYQRNPALAGNPLVNRINGELCRTIFAMSVYPYLDRLGGRAPESLNDAGLRTAIEEASERAAAGLFARIL